MISYIRYKANEHVLKSWIKSLTDTLPNDHESLQYLLIDGEFHGASIGHFRNGPYDLNDVICDLPNADERMIEIIDVIKAANYEKKPLRFCGRDI